LEFVDGIATVNIGGSDENSLFGFTSGGLWGYINQKGEVIIPIIYEDARSFKDGKACVKRVLNEGEIRKYDDDTWGKIDVHGKIIKPFKYTFGEIYYNY
jgi:hypothetical protein